MSIKVADKVGDLKFKRRFAWFPIEIDDFVIQWESYYECRAIRKFEFYIPYTDTYGWVEYTLARAKGLEFSEFKEKCRKGVKSNSGW